MGILDQPEYQEAKRNKQERKEAETDALRFELVTEELSVLADAARIHLQERYPDYAIVLHHAESHDSDESFEAADIIGALKTKRPEIYSLIMKALLKDQ